MEMLKITCPGCKEGIMHSQMVNHMKTCEGIAKLKANGGRKFDTASADDDNKAEEIAMANEARRITLAKKFSAN